MSTPFSSIDSQLEDFCKPLSLKYGKLYIDSWNVGEDNNGRWVRWEKPENNMIYVMQIFPELIEDGAIKNWIFWICAFQDNANNRYTKPVTLYSGSKNYIITHFTKLLASGYKILAKIKESELELGNKIAGSLK